MNCDILGHKKRFPMFVGSNLQKTSQYVVVVPHTKQTRSAKVRATSFPGSSPSRSLERSLVLSRSREREGEDPGNEVEVEVRDLFEILLKAVMSEDSFQIQLMKKKKTSDLIAVIC